MFNQTKLPGIVVLFSGGMDSTIALFAALQTGHRVDAITFDYGQRHRAEISAAMRVVSEIRMNSPWYQNLFTHRVIAFHPWMLPKFGPLMDLDAVVTSHVDKCDQVETDRDTSFIPHRNALFLTIAAMWAQRLGATSLWTGLRGGFPDCTEDFEQALSQMLGVSNPDHPIALYSPVHRSRADSIRLAETIPGCLHALKYTLTCYEGRRPGCGVCLPCTKRAEGFAAVGIDDPALELAS